MQTPEQPADFNSYRNNEWLIIYKKSIHHFMSNGAPLKARLFLQNIVSSLKAEKEYALKFHLEMYFLRQLAEKKMTNSITDDFSTFLDEAAENLPIQEPTGAYLNSVVTFIFQEATQLERILGFQECTSKIYNTVARFFINVNRRPFANQTLLKLGKIQTDKDNPRRNLEEAYTTYTSIFFNLLNHRFDHGTEVTVILNQIKDALRNIMNFQMRQLHSNFYGIICNILETFETQGIDVNVLTSLLETVGGFCDYNLWMNVHNILTILLFINKTYNDPPIPSHIEQILKTGVFYLRDQISVFKAIDEENGQKIRELIHAKIPLNMFQNKETELQHAIAARFKQGVFLLISEGNVDCELTDEKMDPPLYLAIKGADNPEGLEILHQLLQKGVSLLAPTEKVESPLYCAIKLSRVEAGILLARFGAQLTKHELETLEKPTHRFHQLFITIYSSDILQKGVLSRTKETGFDTRLYPLNDDNKLPFAILYCLYELSGHARVYEKIAKNLKKSRHAIGIIDPNISRNPAAVSDDTVELKATQAIVQLKLKQAYGPYILLGYSFGGLLVYEMARQLLMRQEEVAYVGLIDTIAPNVIQNMSKAEYAAHLLMIVEKLKKYMYLETENYNFPRKEELCRLEKKDQIAKLIIDPEIYDLTTQRTRKVVRSNLLAALKYIPNPNCIPLINCLNTETSIAVYNNDKSLGWNIETGNTCASYRIEDKADHFSIVKKRKFCQKITTYLNDHDTVKRADMLRTLQATGLTFVTAATTLTRLSSATPQVTQLYGNFNLQRTISSSGNPVAFFSSHAQALPATTQATEPSPDKKMDLN